MAVLPFAYDLGLNSLTWKWPDNRPLFATPKVLVAGSAWVAARNLKTEGLTIPYEQGTLSVRGLVFFVEEFDTLVRPNYRPPMYVIGWQSMYDIKIVDNEFVGRVRVKNRNCRARSCRIKLAVDGSIVTVGGFKLEPDPDLINEITSEE